MEEVPEDEEHMWELLKDALLKACEGFVESRIREGENLKNDLIGKLDHMLELVDFIEERSPKVIAEYRQKLEEKPHRGNEERTFGRRQCRKKARFYRPGDEPGGKYDPLEIYGS